MSDYRRIEREVEVQRVAQTYVLGRLARHAFAVMGVVLGGLVLIVDPKVATDYFRIFAVAMGTYIVLFAIRIVAFNYKVSKRVVGSPAALLPIHIMTIALSYLLFVVSEHVWVWERFGRDDFFWYGLPLIVAGDVIGIFGLGVMWRFQNEKRRAAEIRFKDDARFRAGDDTEQAKREARELRGTSPFDYRAGDDPDTAEFYTNRRRHFAFRVIMLSVICSGIVALGIIYVIELQARNNAVDSCNLDMQSRALIASQYDEQADNVLGDPNETPPIKAFNFKGTPFEDFQPLIVAQAKANRRRAGELAGSIRDCSQLFPRPRFFGVF